MKQVIKLSTRARIGGPMPQQARKRLDSLTGRARALLKAGETYTTQSLSQALGADQKQVHVVLRSLRPHLLETRGKNLSFWAWKEGE